MEQDSYFSKSVHEHSPMRVYGVAKVIGGLILLAYSLYTFTGFGILMDGINYQNPNQIIKVLPQIFVGVVIFFVSLSFFMNGLRGFKRLTITPNDPPEFRNYSTIVDSLIKGKLEIYKLPNFGPLKFAYHYLSDKVPFLKPAQRRVVSMNVSFMRKYIVLLVLVVLLFVLKGFLPNQFYYEFRVNRDFISPPYLFMGVLFILMGIAFYSIFLLIPNAVPRHHISEKITSIRGGGDPNEFSTLLEKAFYEYRYNGLPNRTDKTGFEKVDKLSFNETGSFEGQFVMETHPRYVGISAAGNIPFLYIGMAFIALLFALFFFSRMEIIAQNMTSFFATIGSLLAGIILFRTSINFFKRSALLLNAYNFESIFVYVNISGTIGKTEITAGKAITDSIETKNVVIRSDSQLKVYATKILSENLQISDDRYVTAMQADDQVEQVLHKIIHEIDQFRDQGVAVRGIDFTSDSINQLTQANVKIQGAKRTQKTESLIESSPQKFLENNPEKSSADEPLASDTKECPQCAETVKVKAKICRFCRYEFES